MHLAILNKSFTSIKILITRKQLPLYKISFMIKGYKYCAFIILLVLTSCSENNNINNQNNMDKIKSINQKVWNQLSQQKIYFGHQSVGYNMVDGMEVVLKENTNIKLNIKKGNNLDLFKNPVFAHDNNGSNGDPKLKIDDFYNTVQKIGSSIDIAGFKLCYVDVEKGTDVNDLFSYYKKRMKEVSLNHPDLTLIYYTVPLKLLQSGPKGFIKKILGKDIGLEDNMARNEFNDLLRKEYQGQVIFDLAEFESTFPNGKRLFSEVDGKKVYTMVPTYTNDGGHLSKSGKKKIGKEYLYFLAELSSK